MKGKLVLLGAAGAAVWGLALLDFGAHERAPAEPQEPPAAPGVQQSPAQRARPVAAQAQPAELPVTPGAPSPEPAKPEVAAAPKNGVLRAAQGTVAVIGKAARALFTSARPEAAAPAATQPAKAPAVRATGELGEGVMSPDYADAEQKFTGEARDGAWAGAAEQRVRALLEPQAWSDRVSAVSCQQSTCRIVIDTDAKDPFAQLLGVPGLSDATGIGPSTPYSLRSGQLSVYFSPPDTERAN